MRCKQKYSFLPFFGATLMAFGASFLGVEAMAATPQLSNNTIALVPGIATDPFYITMQNGAQAEAKKLGLHLIWQGGSSFSPETQIPILQTLLAKNPAVLLIAPTNNVAMVDPIKQFVSAGIPVISVDTTINDSSILKSQITSDNVQGGVAAAKAIASFAHDTGEVAIINVKPGISTTAARQAGFLEQMKKYKNMKVVAVEYDDDSPTKAFTEAQLLLLKYPNIKGFFTTNVFSGEGVGKAVVASGLKGKVDVVGYDAEPDEVEMLKQGIITTLIVQNPAEEGSLAVQYAYDIMTGKGNDIPASKLLPNVTVTSSEANDQKYARYFYSNSIFQ